MKNNLLKKSLAAMTFLVAVCAGTSHATFYNLAAGSFTVSTHIDGVCDNPNGYPVVTIQSSALANSTAGFHLDGSESANHWLKTIQDAVINNRSISLYTNDNWNEALCGRITENGYTGGAYRIVAIRVSP